MEIHELTAGELMARLGDGALSSVEIVEALERRRTQIDRSINAFVLVREQALAEAREADEARRRGELRGPLHGLPITIKDNIDVAGTDSTLGLQARRGKPAERDALLVSELRRKGAIVLGKTNVPQLLLAQETENALFGVTHNPWNLERVPGGSSGGEAAAIASGMSALGIGTDIGGSIRIPAHFCGVVGFKPTLDRWSNRGSQTGIPGQEIVRSQIGCLARSVDDAALLWRALDPRDQSRQDPLVPPLEAGDPVDVRGLTVGWFDDDEFLMPVTSLRRAVTRARDALEAAGARVVTHRSVPSDEVIFLWLGALAADGGRTIDERLSGETISPQLKPSRTLLRLPPAARKAAGALAERLGERRVGRLLKTLGERRVDQLWALTYARTALRLREFDAWRESGIDAVICPAHVVPALRHRESGDFVMSVGAEFRWTLLNFPAGIVPVTRVRAEEVGH
ncbi:MAG TPA: amidase family protein, partial [Polyangiaceae bacterium]|nr:amidase family protein [Polyangiaceae bacterium]